MDIVHFIYVLILAFVFMLFPLPLLFKKMSKNVCALIHAALFAIVLVVIVPYVQKIKVLEGMGDCDCDSINIGQAGSCGMCNTATCPTSNGKCKNPNFGK